VIGKLQQEQQQSSQPRHAKRRRCMEFLSGSADSDASGVSEFGKGLFLKSVYECCTGCSSSRIVWRFRVFQCV
jgi:hypothetical protein